jgi:phosphoribosylformylglycinamidine cyclo-ligase
MPESMSYAKAGVDISATDAAKKTMAASIDRGDARVLNRVGAFASLVDGRFAGMQHPILVLKTEEPGSKQKLAFATGRVRGICFDLINHLVNDLMVMGAEPLYVQDCIICGKLEKEVVTTLVDGMAEACRAQGCVLVGGETSVQPGVVADGLYILSASAVGVVDQPAILDGSRGAAGDVVLALPANGLHTNGYTLVRKLMERNPALAGRQLAEGTFMDLIMRPHLCYYQAVRGLFRHPGLKGLAHITGGGLEGNLNRILPAGHDAILDLPAVRVPEVFRVIQAEGNVPADDMLRTFNLGVGLAAVVAPAAQAEIVAHLAGQGCAAYPIGHLVAGGSQVVRYQGAIAW